ncbi:hypothetical protein FK216_07075 [Moraxellaceae bacterium AER2_44_116]|nr:hypothetical protein [Moraxellaceae bacterium]TQC98050.1 hypothetical protein FK216_07075 [Moraxellaceae bacterium AER2_44_116]
MDHIKKSIIAFLKNPTLKVIAIKGDWGVGKTHFWQNKIITKIFSDVEEKILLEKEYYSYVSLFNIENITDLKTKIYYESKSINNDNSKIKSYNHIELINQSTTISQQLQKIKIDNYLICLDDIERKSKKISLQTILGYISELKENYNNKIVIIFNENELSRHDKILLHKYKEKIIDASIEYKPSAEYNQNIIFKDHLYIEIIKKALEPMNVKNMRILKFIENNIDFFFKSLKNIYLSMEETVKLEVVSTIVFDTWLYYQTEINISLQELEDFFSYRIKLSEEKEIIRRKIINYGYHHLEEYEKEIINYLLEGYFNEEKLTLELQKLSEKKLKNQKLKTLMISWKNYGVSTTIISLEMIPIF